MELDTIICAKAEDYLATLPDNSVDVIITDPPYGVNKATWDKNFPTDWIEQAWRVTSRMLVMTGNTNMIYAANALNRYTDCIVMHSRNGMTRSKVSFGNWFPVLVCGDWKWRPVPNYIPFNVKTDEKINHPDPKPLQAMLKLIDYYTETSWIICDPFMGSGTTALAAKRLGRHYVGCELSQEYVDMANARLDLPQPIRMFTD